MKILMVSEDLPGRQIGGLAKHVVTLSNALLAAGHHVAILGRSDVAGADWSAGLDLHAPIIGGFALAHPGWKELQMGVFNPLKRPWFAHRIARAIMAHARGYDVVHYHGHLPMVGCYVGDALNFVQTRHDQGSECMIHLRFRDDEVCSSTAARDCAGCIAPAPGLLRQRVSALAVDSYRAQAAAAFARHKTIFVSDFLRRQFLRAVPGASLARCRVLHNVIDYAALRAQADGVHALPGHVLLAGRIDTGKGFAQFCAAAANRLPPQLHVCIAGDGPARTMLASRYHSEQLRFIGWQHHAQIVALAARSHVCVVPSVCEEACSTTVLEALALGKPCLALRRGGTPELAAYQQYPGQLQLAENMHELVARLLAIAEQAPANHALAPTFGADAAHMLPALLATYAC